MKKQRLLARTASAGLGVIAVLAVGMSTAFAGAVLNAVAPDFTGVDSNSQDFQLSSLKGKKVILEWTNHKCPYVRKHYETENMQSLQAEAREAGYYWVSIISSAPGRQGYVTGTKANELSQSRSATPDLILLDESGDIGHLYDARTTPQIVILDEGSVVRYMGAIDDKPSANHASVATASNYVKAAMSDLAKGQPVSEPVTTPYGCAVKY
jgi:hypothetical protein